VKLRPPSLADAPAIAETFNEVSLSLYDPPR
jgi:hypothetical protein